MLEKARPLEGDKDKFLNFVNHGGVAIITRHGFAIAKIDLKIKVISFVHLTVRATTKSLSSLSFS